VAISWYQRWFGYTPEYQRITWGLLGLILGYVVVVLTAISAVALLIYVLVFR